MRVSGPIAANAVLRRARVPESARMNFRATDEFPVSGEPAMHLRHAVFIALLFGSLHGLMGCSKPSDSGDDCEIGAQGCRCYVNETCNTGLTCAEGTCTRAHRAKADADTAEKTGDGHGEETADECGQGSRKGTPCGSSGECCSSREVCRNGKCVCPDELTSCAGECVDTDTDKDHCGGCGRVCDGLACRYGQCVRTRSAVGEDHSCAVRSSGKVYCWGTGSHGELGNGSRADSASPVEVIGIDSAIAVAAGDNHSCARLEGGGVRCWGAGKAGELGDGSTADSSTPVEVKGI